MFKTLVFKFISASFLVDDFHNHFGLKVFCCIFVSFKATYVGNLSKDVLTQISFSVSVGDVVR